MTLQTQDSNNVMPRRGFTLFELVVVMAIISAMIAVALPLCRRSNEGLKITQDSSNIAQALRYAIDLAERKNIAVRFVFNDRYRSFHLEIEESGSLFAPLDDFAGKETFIDKSIHLFDIEGFQQDGPEYVLTLEPQNQWPSAWISLATTDLTKTIRVRGKYVAVEEESI